MKKICSKSAFCSLLLIKFMLNNGMSTDAYMSGFADAMSEMSFEVNGKRLRGDTLKTN